jgi:hypothetical protein
MVTWRAWENRLLVPILRISDLVDLGWSLKICISNKFPIDAGPWPTLIEKIPRGRPDVPEEL